VLDKNGWSLIYEQAIYDDGRLLFPERLNKKFLDAARKTMGSYLFANQYLNQVIPEDEKRFRPEWLRYYDQIPKGCYSFGFIDPAIGQDKHHDYTGIVIIDLDTNGNWYLRVASRQRLTPTEIVAKMFEIHREFKLLTLGVEVVAYQEALLYILDEEMKKRGVVIPVTGVTRNKISKNTRILGLVPRFEWGRLYLAKGLTDFEDEYASFPRGGHDDLLDALASCEEIARYPQAKKEILTQPHSQHDPKYESWRIAQMVKQANRGDDE